MMQSCQWFPHVSKTANPHVLPSEQRYNKDGKIFWKNFFLYFDRNIYNMVVFCTCPWWFSITNNVVSSNSAQMYSMYYVINVCQWLATGRWFSPDSSTNKTDYHDITEILLKVVVKHHIEIVERTKIDTPNTNT
jgi:hypothetical protein